MRSARKSCNGRVLSLLQLNELQKCVVKHDERNHDATKCTQPSFDALVSSEIEGRNLVRKLIKVHHFTEEPVFRPYSLAGSRVLHSSFFNIYFTKFLYE